MPVHRAARLHGQHLPLPDGRAAARAGAAQAGRRSRRRSVLQPRGRHRRLARRRGDEPAGGPAVARAAATRPGSGPQGLAPSMIDASDLVLCATARAGVVVLHLRPDAAARTFVLGEFGRLLTDVTLPALDEAAGDLSALAGENMPARAPRSDTVPTPGAWRWLRRWTRLGPVPPRAAKTTWTTPGGWPRASTPGSPTKSSTPWYPWLLP